MNAKLALGVGGGVLSPERNYLLAYRQEVVTALLDIHNLQYCKIAWAQTMHGWYCCRL